MERGSDHFFYTVHDDAYRPFQVWRHALGTPVADDVLVLEEPDERFELQRAGHPQRALVVIWAESRDTTEVWVRRRRDADVAAALGGRPASGHRVPRRARGAARRHGDAAAGHQRRRHRVPARPLPGPPRLRPGPHVLAPARAERPAERLERVDAFAGHAVLSFRSEAQHRLRVLPLDALDGDGFVIASAFAHGTVLIGPNTEYDATAVTVEDQSYVDPPVWSDVDLRTGERTELLRREAPGHDPSSYVCERRTFPPQTAPSCRRPSYGTGTPRSTAPRRRCSTGTAPTSRSTRTRSGTPRSPRCWTAGVVYVHAHVRGGGEGGRRWWLEGRMEHKQNTFTDYVAVADGLAESGLVDGDRIATRGLSAGGLLQGAVFSQRPDRWRAVVAEVPFVDVVTTMFDASIPLTVTEWDEWGDPRRARTSTGCSPTRRTTTRRAVPGPTCS